MGKKSERRERRIALARARDAAERGAEAGQWIRSAHRPLQAQAPTVSTESTAGDAPTTTPAREPQSARPEESDQQPSDGAAELQPLGPEPIRLVQRDPRAAIARRAHGSRLAMLLAMTASLGPGSR
jgi:hypothetical protein